MKSDITPFERWMRNKIKKNKHIGDEKILEEMLMGLKRKHEEEKEQKIQALNREIEKIKL